MWCRNMNFLGASTWNLELCPVPCMLCHDSACVVWVPCCSFKCFERVSILGPSIHGHKFQACANHACWAWQVEGLIYLIDASFTELQKKTYLNLETGSGKSLGLAALPDAMELTSGLPLLSKLWPFMDAVVAVRAAEEDPTIFTQARIFAGFHLFLFRCSLCSRVFLHSSWSRFEKFSALVETWNLYGRRRERRNNQKSLDELGHS